MDVSLETCHWERASMPCQGRVEDVSVGMRQSDGVIEK